MSDLAVHLCDACGRSMRAVPMQHRDGTITTSYECGDFTCSAGPGGVMTFSERGQKDTAVSRTKFWGNGSFHDMSKGRPSQNEGNVEPVAKAFIAAANRQFGTDYDGDDGEYLSKPSRKEGGYDCVIWSKRRKHQLKLQVTRALPEDIYRKQGEQGERAVMGTTADAVAWILTAIAKKASRASPCIALVIDGIDVPSIGIFADEVVMKDHREVLDAQKWHSIWVIGQFGLRHLGGRCLPGGTSRP